MDHAKRRETKIEEAKLALEAEEKAKADEENKDASTADDDQ